MSDQIIHVVTALPAESAGTEPPAIIHRAGNAARFAYAEFFETTIANEHTRVAYRRAADRFLAWCEDLGLELQKISPGIIARYIKQLTRLDGKPASKPMKKLHLTAIRQFFDLLVVRHAVVLNSAASVKGPRLSMTQGKTPSNSPKQARRLLESIRTNSVVGLRDKTIIAVLIFTAARAGAVSRLTLGDFYDGGDQCCLRIDEKGGKIRDIPVRHDLQELIKTYIAVAGLKDAPGDTPLFRSARGRTRQLTDRAIEGKDICYMVKRRFKAVGLPAKLTPHTFRATTATDLLEQGIDLKDVQTLLGHADPRTTRLYDHTGKKVTRNIVERISV